MLERLVDHLVGETIGKGDESARFWERCLRRSRCWRKPAEPLVNSETVVDGETRRIFMTYLAWDNASYRMKPQALCPPRGSRPLPLIDPVLRTAAGQSETTCSISSRCRSGS